MRGRIWLLVVLILSLLTISVHCTENGGNGHLLADDEDFDFDTEDVIDLDNEDVVTPETQTTETQTTETVPQADKSPPFFPESLPTWLQNGRLESGCIVVLVFAALQAFVGKKQNEKLIETWARTTREFFTRTFEVCGFNDSVLKAFGWDYFEYFASGRSNCSYCLVKLQCRPRQCPWQDLLVGYLTGSDDVMDIEIPLTMPEKFSLVVGRRMQLKTLQNLNKDLGSCISIKKSQQLSSRLCVLSDSGEVVDKLITQDIADALNAHAKSIRHLIISDIVPSDRFADVTPDNKILRFSVAIPSEDKMQEVVPLLEALISLVDGVASLTLSEQAREKVKKAREALQKRQMQETEEERREALEKKKAEKRQEEAERVKQMAPQARAKWEEKQQKKEAKNQKPRMKMVKA